MADILQDLADKCAAYEDGILEDMTAQETYILLSRAVGEIDRLRKANSDMGWRLNPDRMGGQFTDDERNDIGWR